MALIISENPKISVVMAAFNEASFIELAIQSILNQTFKDFEFIIVNDCSVDSTASILKKYSKLDARIKIITNEVNQGLAKSLNIAINTSRASLIARMDANDWSFPERLELQYQYLEQNLQISVVGSNALLIDGSGKSLNKTCMPLSPDEIKKSIIKKCPLIHPSVIFRRQFFLEMNGYNDRFRKKQDYDLWFRGCEKFLYANIENALIKYSIQPQKTLKTDMYGFYVRIINAFRLKKILPGVYWAFLTFLTCIAKKFGYKSKMHRELI